MAQAHRSTPVERTHYVQHLLVHRGEYGVVTQLSRAIGASRQTLYAWLARGEQALAAAFQPSRPPTLVTPALERQILTLLVEGHASYRGLQRIMAGLLGQRVSLAAISAVVATAQARARQWLTTHLPPTARAVALDELYGKARRGAYLHVVDVTSGAVWAAEGPLPVDAETWTLVLWEAEAHGLRWSQVVTDGAGAMQQACATVAPAVAVQRDLWHVLHRCGQVQGRVDRQWAALATQSAVVARQAARLAAGQSARGRRPQVDPAAHDAAVADAWRTSDALRFLTAELHRLLDVVVLDARGLLDYAQRHADLATVLALLAEVAAAAPAAVQREVRGLHKHLTQALPGLLVFAAALERVQQDLRAVLPVDHQAVLAWAWQRRDRWGVAGAALAAWVPESWRPAAQVLLHAWECAVRVSSAVERWHSILRPHVAVHRTLSPGLLALLAVWHNHRAFPRGDHRGHNPLHLSGFPDAPTDWLVALGYPPADTPPLPIPAPIQLATPQRSAA